MVKKVKWCKEQSSVLRSPVQHMSGRQSRISIFMQFVLCEIQVADRLVTLFFSHIGYGTTHGQNLAWGHSSWDHAIQDWFNEVNDFVFGVGKRPQRAGEDDDDYKKVAVGHYTQVNKLFDTFEPFFSNDFYTIILQNWENF